jgi:pilus assembly protein CpaE
MARGNAGDVLLFDMSLPYNHAALLAGLAPSSSLARVADSQERFDELLKSALVYHRAGFFVLSAALTPEEADLVTPALLERALGVLRRQFAYVLVDLSTTLSEPVLAVLERSDQVVLVAVPEFSVMKDLIQVKRILLEVLQLPLARIHLIANHRNATSRIGRREIESIVGLAVDHEVRFDGGRPEEAALQGEILAVSDPSSQLTKGVAALARTLSDQRQV